MISSSSSIIMSSPTLPELEEDNLPCPTNNNILRNITSELKKQQSMAMPLYAMNFMWLVKISITTMFLGRLGELQLAGGALGSMFANVTGISVLSGLAGAMDPICGQAYGANNFKLLHKTLVMTIMLLLLFTLPICFLWLNVDKILVLFGLQHDMISMAKTYMFYLLPNLVIMSFQCPLKAYLSAQGITIPIMLSSFFALSFHVPLNILLSKSMGVPGVAISVWLSDLVMTIVLMISVVVIEIRGEGKWKEGGWWDQKVKDWTVLLRLCGPCCLTSCLEWVCYEVLVLIAGRLPNPTESVSVLVIVQNFDSLMFSVVISIATCAATRVSNELGLNHAKPAAWSTYVSLGTAAFTACVGAVIMVGTRGLWASLFSHNREIIKGVKKMMILMALIQLGNFPLTVLSGILRGTARPWLSTYANLCGFYLVALPVGVALSFKAKLGVEGLFFGLMAGVAVCLFMVSVFVARTDWDEEAANAQVLASGGRDIVQIDGEHEMSETRENIKVSA